MKKYLFGALAVVLAVGLSSFTSKRTFSTMYYYIDGSEYQRVEYQGQTSGPAIAKSLEQDPDYNSTSPLPQFRRTGNWTTDDELCSGVAAGELDDSRYVFKFEISQEEGTSDGDDDGFITLSEALQAIHKEFKDNHVFPTGVFLVDLNNNATGTNVDITVAEASH